MAASRSVITRDDDAAAATTDDIDAWAVSYTYNNNDNNKNKNNKRTVGPLCGASKVCPYAYAGCFFIR